MIQDIAPKKFDNTYSVRTVKDTDIVMLFENNQILLSEDAQAPELLTQQQLKLTEKELYYLFELYMSF